MTVLSIARAALVRFLRERSNFFFVFILPIAIVILTGVQFGPAGSPEIGLVGVQGEFADEIVDGLVEAGYDPETFDDEETLVLAVERNQVNAGLVFPDGFSEGVENGGSLELGYVATPDSAGAALRAAVEGVVVERLAPVAAARTIVEVTDAEFPAALDAAVEAAGQTAPTEVSTRTVGDALFPATLGQFDIGASSQLVLFVFLTGLSGSAALIQNRQLGVTRRMLASPITTRTIIAGEATGRWAVGMFQGLYIAFLTAIAFGVDWGDPLGTAAVLILLSAVGAGAAMLLGSVFSNDQQAGGVSVVLGLGLAALGGSMVPLELFPETMRQVSKLTPHAWANDAFAEMVRRDGTFVDILPQLGVLAAFAVGLLGIASVVLRRAITNP